MLTCVRVHVRGGDGGSVADDSSPRQPTPLSAVGQSYRCWDLMGAAKRSQAQMLEVNEKSTVRAARTD